MWRDGSIDKPFQRLPGVRAKRLQPCVRRPRAPPPGGSPGVNRTLSRATGRESAGTPRTPKASPDSNALTQPRSVWSAVFPTALAADRHQAHNRGLIRAPHFFPPHRFEPADRHAEPSVETLGYFRAVPGGPRLADAAIHRATPNPAGGHYSSRRRRGGCRGRLQSAPRREWWSRR